jgi:hypothetical protein
VSATAAGRDNYLPVFFDVRIYTPQSHWQPFATAHLVLKFSLFSREMYYAARPTASGRLFQFLK